MTQDEETCRLARVQVPEGMPRSRRGLKETEWRESVQTCTEYSLNAQAPLARRESVEQEDNESLRTPEGVAAKAGINGKVSVGLDPAPSSTDSGGSSMDCYRVIDGMTGKVLDRPVPLEPLPEFESLVELEEMDTYVLLSVLNTEHLWLSSH